MWPTKILLVSLSPSGSLWSELTQPLNWTHKSANTLRTRQLPVLNFPLSFPLWIFSCNPCSFCNSAAFKTMLFVIFPAFLALLSISTSLLLWAIFFILIPVGFLSNICVLSSQHSAYTALASYYRVGMSSFSSFHLYTTQNFYSFCMRGSLAGCFLIF